MMKAVKQSDRSKGGRPPFPAELVFKPLVMQALYNLSDDQAEFVIQDQLSFMLFLSLSCMARFRMPKRSGYSTKAWCGPAPSRI